MMGSRFLPQTLHIFAKREHLKWLRVPNDMRGLPA